MWDWCRPLAAGRETEVAFPKLVSWKRGATTSPPTLGSCALMHAKALLFFLVFLPQVVVPGKVPVEQQLFMLGCTLTVISTTFHTLLAAIASSTSTFLARHAESRSSALLGSPPRWAVRSLPGPRKASSPARRLARRSLSVRVPMSARLARIGSSDSADLQRARPRQSGHQVPAHQARRGVGAACGGGPEQVFDDGQRSGDGQAVSVGGT